MLCLEVEVIYNPSGGEAGGRGKNMGSGRFAPLGGPSPFIHVSAPVPMEPSVHLQPVTAYARGNVELFASQPTPSNRIRYSIRFNCCRPVINCAPAILILCVALEKSMQNIRPRDNHPLPCASTLLTPINFRLFSNYFLLFYRAFYRFEPPFRISFKIRLVTIRCRAYLSKKLIN